MRTKIAAWVLAVIGVLAVGASYMLSQSLDTAERRTLSQMEYLAQQIVSINEERDVLPDSLRNAFPEMHAAGRVPIDHWGNPYGFNAESRCTFTISSSGSDGAPDTEDDLLVSRNVCETR